MIYRIFIGLFSFLTLICHAQEKKRHIIFKVKKAIQTEATVFTISDKLKIEEPVYTFAEVQATFRGGDLYTFRDWVQSNIVYPAFPDNKNISGYTTVQFTVNSKGIVVDIKISHGLEKEFDNEVVRVISSSPTWQPGKQCGKAVNQLFTLPIKYNSKVE